MGSTVDELCPISSLLRYMARSGSSPGALFRCVDGSPLTKAKFVSEVRTVLTEAGLLARNYSGHCFRKWATATSMAAGIEDFGSVEKYHLFAILEIGLKEAGNSFPHISKLPDIAINTSSN